MSPPPSVARDLTGASFGDYQVLRRLGRGAMADVYLAEQRSLNRQVALKVLKDELARDEKSLRRFRNEATAAAALVHASIVQVYEVGEHDGFHYIAQEYVSGGTVGELIRRHVSLEPKMVVAVLRQAAAALARAAQEGIVHRDIKPENVLLSRTGEVKVADFGLARAATREGVDLTQAGVTMGTPLYMSPEQIEGRELSPSSDIYSLGVTAYHMLVGRPPFTGETPLAVAVQHLNSQPPRLEVERPDVPPSLARIVHKMLAKRPADRYAGGGELLADLRTVAKDLGSDADGWEEWATAEMLALAGNQGDATARLGELMQTTSLLQSRRPSRRWIVAAGVLSLCLGVAGGVWLRTQPLLAAPSASAVESKGDPWAQLYHAKIVDTPAAWLSVRKHFSGAEYELQQRLADLGLALYYYRKEFAPHQALEILADVAESSSYEDLAALGLAFTAIINAETGDLQGHNQAWVRLHQGNKLDRLPREVKQELVRAQERNFDRLGAEARAQLESLRSDVEDAEEEAEE